MCESFSRQGAGRAPPGLSVDGLRANDQVTAGRAVHDVGSEPIDAQLELPRQALLDLPIAHTGRQLELPLTEIVRMSLEANVHHHLTSKTKRPPLRVFAEVGGSACPGRRMAFYPAGPPPPATMARAP